MPGLAGQFVFGAFLVLMCGCNSQQTYTEPNTIRVATFNVSMYRNAVGGLYEGLASRSKQAKALACIIQKVRPDIILLNEFDYDPEGRSAKLFINDYLAVSQYHASPITYPYHYTSSVNTGLPSGFDLDNDGKMSGPGDAFGYGQFPGQYGMVILSKYPIHSKAVRTFQNFLWKDMPDALLPDDPSTSAANDWYSQRELDVFRLSSKSHWDVPVIVGKVIHLLISHPAPPVFDGPENRNGRRNHDEIRFWADYIDPQRSGYIYDDKGNRGGITADAFFVVLGDLNADPLDGDSTDGAVRQLLQHPAICDPEPSRPPSDRPVKMDGINDKHRGRPGLDTYQAVPGKLPGNLRLDYVLPSCNIKVTDSGVFWPSQEDPLLELVDATDHRMVYVNIQINGSNDNGR